MDIETRDIKFHVTRKYPIYLGRTRYFTDQSSNTNITIIPLILLEEECTEIY